VDPFGYVKRLKTFGAGLASMVSHPGDALAALTDLETLEDNPSRWVGKQIPDLLLTLATAGAAKAAATGGKGATIAVHAVEKAEDIADVADAADLLGDTSMALRKKAKLSWTDGDGPAPPSSAGRTPTTSPAPGSSARAGDDGLFRNAYPEDSPGEFQRVPPDVAGARSGRYVYVVTEDGTLVIGRAGRAGHVDLANGFPVRAAGEFTTKGGEVVAVSNASGPTCQVEHRRAKQPSRR
jgi:hypothetical protein